MKKFLCLALAMIMLFSLCACGKEAVPPVADNDNSPSEEYVQNIYDDTSTTNTDEDEPFLFPTTLSTENFTAGGELFDTYTVINTGAYHNMELPSSMAGTVVYDENDIKVTLTGIKESWLNEEILFNIENGSDEDIHLDEGTNAVWFNGKLVNGTIAGFCAAHSTNNFELIVNTPYLAIAGINTFESLQFDIHIYTDDWFGGDAVTVKVGDVPEELTAPEYKTIMDNEYVKIGVIGIYQEDGNESGGIVQFYVEQKGEYQTYFHEFMVNGHEMTGSNIMYDFDAEHTSVFCVEFDLANNIDDGTQISSLRDVTDLRVAPTVIDRNEGIVVEDSFARLV